jgi:TetR/AcrR family transcriptional repressor of nem operon
MAEAMPETKKRLIAAALELIWRSSYGSVSVDDICKTADVRKGSFYHFFPSKADLAVAAMEHSFEEIRPDYDRIFSASAAPLKRIEDLVAFIYESQREASEKYGHVCGCPCASLGSEMGAQEPDIRRKFDDQRRRMTRYYENALRDLVAEGFVPAATDVKAKADELFAYIMGRVMLARIQNDLGPLKHDLKDGILRTLGVAAGKEKAA